MFLFSCRSKVLTTEDFDKAPDLVIVCNGKKTPALQATYSWTSGSRGAEADSDFPARLTALMTPIEIEKPVDVQLDFELKPDKIEVRYWDEAVLTPAVLQNAKQLYNRAQELEVSGSIIRLPDIKNCVYEVYAVWQGERGTGGSSWYGFCTTGK